jgi:hypothetical protein
VALLELDVDIGKGLADALAERDQAIIGAECDDNENDEDGENNPAGRHDNNSWWDKEGKRRRKKPRAAGRHEVVIPLVCRKAG